MASLTWRIDLVRPCEVSEEHADAWRGLLMRLRTDDPVFADPDYLVPAAQHEARGLDPIFAFAWARGGRERLEGVACLAQSRSFWGRSRLGPWNPAGLTLAPTVNPDHASAVGEALGAALSERGWSSPSAFAAAQPREIGDRSGPLVHAVVEPERDIPSRNLLGIRSKARTAAEPARITRVTEPDLIRDAVEEFLGLDARVSPRPIIADPSEAAMVRVVTRLFARRRQATVEILHRADRIVGARLRLGHGPNAVLWKQVQDRRDDDRASGAGGRIAG